MLTEQGRLCRPPFDPELAAALPGLPKVVTTFNREQLPELREFMSASRLTTDQLTRGGNVIVSERTVPGTSTSAPEITLLILTPREHKNSRPAIYHIHGGGMVSGDRYSLPPEAPSWVEDLGVVLVSVEYRLAPEHPYPAPVEDCYAGLVWLATHADELGIDKEKLAILGLSAGGGLAAAVALLARDRGGPVLTHQFLGCPMIDDRGITHSSQELDGEGSWDRTSNQTGWDALLGDRAQRSDVPYYAAPARAEDLSGLPPTFIDVGQAETFRDESITYAARLSRAGVPVEFHMWPGGFHGFAQGVPHAPVSRAANSAIRDALERAFR